MKALFDTHIVIDYLCGRPEAKREIERYEQPMLSAITVAEIMAAATTEEVGTIDAFFKRFEIVPCDAGVAGLAAGLKQRHALGMECALVWASARAQSAVFITRNDAFPEEAGIHKPY